LPTSLFILPVESADGGSSLRKLIPSYCVGSRDRSQADVHAGDTIRVRLETAFDAAKLPPTSTVASGYVATLPASLACVPGFNFYERYSQQFRFVTERMSEESVGYSIGFAPALSRELAIAPFQVSEVFDGDLCAVSLGEFRDCFCKFPSVCANIVSLSSAEPPELQSCFASMSVLISVFLQFGSAVLVADLSKRDVPSQVDLLQKSASYRVHHGDSNAVAVLVDPENVVGCVRSGGFLLKYSEKAVATSHQDTCDNPVICQMLLHPSVSAIFFDW